MKKVGNYGLVVKVNNNAMNQMQVNKAIQDKIEAEEWTISFDLTNQFENAESHPYWLDLK